MRSVEENRRKKTWKTKITRRKEESLAVSSLAAWNTGAAVTQGRTSQSLYYSWSTNIPAGLLWLTHTRTHHVNKRDMHVGSSCARALTLANTHTQIRPLSNCSAALPHRNPDSLSYSPWLHVFHFLNVLSVCVYLYICVSLFWQPETSLSREQISRYWENNKWKLFSGICLLLLDPLLDRPTVGAIVLYMCACVCVWICARPFRSRQGKSVRPGLVFCFYWQVHGTKQKGHREWFCEAPWAVGCVYVGMYLSSAMKTLVMLNLNH